ncbi:MAG: hypothetical protein RKO24_04790, partial [Candidatus Competibacter sp.]|nr:hypothetical protein [Candidatus Competibacter sp.]
TVPPLGGLVLRPEPLPEPIPVVAETEVESPPTEESLEEDSAASMVVLPPLTDESDLVEEELAQPE